MNISFTCLNRTYDLRSDIYFKNKRKSDMGADTCPSSEDAARKPPSSGRVRPMPYSSSWLELPANAAPGDRVPAQHMGSCGPQGRPRLPY